MKTLLALCCCLPLVLPAQAQTVQRQAQVYRCGPDGRDLRDSPCAGSAAASSVSFDEPSPADRRAARERHLADARQAAALAAARRASDAEARRQHAQRFGPPAAPPAPPKATPAAPASAPHARPPKLTRPHKPAKTASGPAPAGR